MYNFYKENLVHLPPRSRIHQILRIMKITTLILIAVILHVSAASLAQKVTLVEKNAQLVDVFQHIHKQTGYDFLFTGSDLKNAKPVNINAKDEELTEVLQKIFEGQSMDYTIENNTVVIKEKETNLIDKAKALFAQVTVTGKVVDETNQPLPGVTVKIKGTNTATATDAKGAYSLTVPDDKTIIVFSFVGFESQELAAKDIPAGSVIKMKATETNLKEVVVSKGYYNEKRELLTGNVSTVTAKEISTQPVSDPILALIGRVPGLSITQSSGIPGAFANIRIRGQNSLINGNDPLFIVDGVPVTATSLSGTSVTSAASITNGRNSLNGGLSPFNSLNPADIETIEVLKDADATAIYGSRGANGVILITTKKGQAGQTKVDLDVSSGVGRVGHTMPFLNTQQYLAVRHQALNNDGILPGPADYDVNGTWDTTRYTNWQNYFIGNTSHFSTANLSLSGGNANTQFLINGAYSKQTTVYPGDFNDQKASVHLNLNHISTNQKFRALFNVQYGVENNFLPGTDIATLLNQLPPDAPALYDASGNINWQNGTWYNPLAYSFVTAVANNYNLNSSVNMSYEVLPGLKFQSNVGYTRMELKQSKQSPATINYGPPVSTNRRDDIANSSISTYIIEPQINYAKDFKGSKLTVLVGGTIQRDLYNTLALRGSGFSSDALIDNIINASSIIVLGSTFTDYRYSALYSRLNYNLADKYIINVTARRDGSSRFGPGKQFGNFGAVGAAWIFSKEKFIEDAFPFLSIGKLRASYGVTGNDQIANYQYLSTYGALGSYQNTAGLAPKAIANSYFAWEVAKKLEGGLDLGFLQDRINLTVSYYQNRIGNQLVGQPLPSQDGFTSIQANLPAVVQNTGFEGELNTINIKTPHFSWSSSFNISFQRDKLLSFPGLENNPSYKNSYIVGQSVSAPLLYHFTGTDPQSGFYTFKDINNDGNIGTDDSRTVVAVRPDYFCGLSNNLSYKNWEFSFFIQGVKQLGFNYLRTIKVPGGAINNLPIYVLDSNSPILFTTGAGRGSSALTPYRELTQSDAVITDASFIRLKNVSLSYSLPQSWLQRLGVKNSRIFAEAQNLLTITGYKGYDPETQSTNLPPLRMISLGIHLSL